MAEKINSRTLWNIAAIVALCVIVLAIGIFIGRTLTMNTPGNPVIATVSPDDDSFVITLPSAGPTVTQHPTLSATPAASLKPSAVTPTPTVTVTPTPTTHPTNTPTPIPTVTITPTPTTTPYPTQEPQPNDYIQDGPFYESITPIKTGDFLPPVSDENSYDPGNGPIFIDMEHSNMGSPWAYPGDTLGIGLKLNNYGPAIDTYARVTMSLQKMFIVNGTKEWIDTGITKQFSTRIAMGDHGTMQKNISYTVPTDMPYIKGTYKIYIKFYLHDQYSAGVVKVLTIL